MSRTLARLRAATRDPLLVRAGRGLVPTPRALDLRERVRDLTREAQAVLSPQRDELDVCKLEQTFTIRASEGFLALFSLRLVKAVADAAPQACLRFAPKSLKEAAPLRDGKIDLEVGVLGTFAPEVRTQLLFRDQFVGVVRAGHDLLDSPVTPQRYAACKHVVSSRKGAVEGPVDEALAGLGLSRNIVAVMPGFLDALRIARHSDLVALVPKLCMRPDQAEVASIAEGLVSFQLPVPTPEITISLMWHPRMDADPANRWLRGVVKEVCNATLHNPGEERNRRSAAIEDRQGA